MAKKVENNQNNMVFPMLKAVEQMSRISGA